MKLEQCINDLEPSAQRASASLTLAGNITLHGKAALHAEDKRGSFWPRDPDGLDDAISSANITVNGQSIEISTLRRCHVHTSDHWHFDLP